MKLFRPHAIVLLAALGCARSDSSTPVPPTGFLPCEVDRIFKNICQNCHSNPPSGGAPVPLLTYEDTQAKSPSDPTGKVWQLMRTYIASDFMPLDPFKLQPGEKAALLAWLDGGAKSAAARCVQ